MIGMISVRIMAVDGDLSDTSGNQIRAYQASKSNVLSTRPPLPFLSIINNNLINGLSYQSKPTMCISNPPARGPVVGYKKNVCILFWKKKKHETIF